MLRLKRIFVLLSFVFIQLCYAQDKGPLFYYWNEEWHGQRIINFGDYISLKLIERIVNGPVRVCYNPKTNRERKLLAIGSIFSYAYDGDIVWGSGINGKVLKDSFYKFKSIDIRAVRGPLTRQFLKDRFHIECPEVYGDPALLLPYFFPEFKRKKQPSLQYIVIPHYSERKYFSGIESPLVIYPTEPWDKILEKILDSEFVISSSLHGIIVAEAFGVPARLLRVSENEPLFKYQDYYWGTNRPNFNYATSIEEALQMGGEAAPECDLRKLYEAFPFELWPDTTFQQPDFFKGDILL